MSREPYTLIDPALAQCPTIGGLNVGAYYSTTTKGGSGMRLDLSSAAYTLIFAGIAIWAVSKLVRA